MAFWGVEVKPGEDYIHRYDSDQGTLHISQATLGSGKSTKKCILQCTVGSQKPIYLCSLLPDKLETCLLNLEFEEEEEVTLSVIGSHSVHLSGFFVGEYGNEDKSDESDSDQFEGHCGSDCESDESMDYGFDDEDDDEDFVDDDDDDMYPVRSSGVRIEEIVDDENPAKESGALKQTKKKKHQTNESNDGKNAEKQIVVKSSSAIPVVEQVESEDEDGFPVSSPGKRKTETSNNNKVNDNKVKDASGKKDAVDNVQASSENGTKLGKRKKNKKNMDAEEKIPETNDENSSLQEANIGKGEQTNEKKKPKEKKKKNKKLKSENAAGLNAPETTTDKSMSTVDTETKNEDEPFQVRTFPNGLVIEEVSMGRPDGKKAAPGKKVSVRYVGKLKKTGKIFDSNIGRAPFKFRLGIGQVIKGWDVGVNGMRVGDKRRLTIPPSMGYGDKGAGPDIPPNAWLVFDVELVDVM